MIGSLLELKIYLGIFCYQDKMEPIRFKHNYPNKMLSSDQNYQDKMPASVQDRFRQDYQETYLTLEEIISRSADHQIVDLLLNHLEHIDYCYSVELLNNYSSFKVNYFR